jgi:hypothetical protein
MERRVEKIPKIHKPKIAAAKILKTDVPLDDTRPTTDAVRTPAGGNLIDAESLEAITPRQAPGLLRDFHAAAFRLFVTLRDLSELPPEKMPKGVKRLRDKRFDMNWNAAHPAWNSRLDQSRLRDRFIDVSKASDLAWRSVELLADTMDGDDDGARRWSIAARLAILNALPFGTSNVPGSFEVMCKLVRLYAADTLNNLRRRIDALNDCVTTVELFLFEPKSIRDLMAPKTITGENELAPLRLPASHYENEHGIPQSRLQKARRDGRLTDCKLENGRWLFPDDQVRRKWPDDFLPTAQ